MSTGNTILSVPTLFTCSDVQHQRGLGVVLKFKRTVIKALLFWQWEGNYVPPLESHWTKCNSIQYCSYHPWNIVFSSEYHNSIEIDPNGDSCVVCFDIYKPQDVVRILTCKHFFHKACIDPWLLAHRTCPMCKCDILKT